MPCITLTNVRLVDGTGRPPVEPASLIIENQRIAHVGPVDEIDLPSDSRVIDCRGMTVLPGLIDGHMHLTGMPGTNGTVARLRGQLQASELLRKCLLWGTTTVGHAAGCDHA